MAGVGVGSRADSARVRGVASERPQLGAGPMVPEAVVEEVVAALAHGASVSEVARDFGLDRKTVRAWRHRGRYRPRTRRGYASQLDPHQQWLADRAPEVDYNAVVLHRELVAYRGFAGSVIIVRRAVAPLRAAAAPSVATVRFETAPGEQAQVDFGQVRVWIADQPVTTHVFVCTLGYSRRQFAIAYPHERIATWLDGHEQAFRHFGGVPQVVVVDNAKAMVLAHATRETIRWHPTYADFAGYYGFRPWACTPHRPQTKGKVESGVKYVARNALAGRRFRSWDELNAWLVEWATTIADVRCHGTTFERPIDRFAAEGLRALDGRPAYTWTHVRDRLVATDALVAIDGARYSVPATLVGRRVLVHEHATGFTILDGDTVVATHARAPRHTVVMAPEHYAGLLRVDRRPRVAPMPRHDPRYPVQGEVMVRDLAVYDAIARGEDAA